MTRMLALGQWSAAALAKSRTMEALVEKRSDKSASNPLSLFFFSFMFHNSRGANVPSRVMPGLRGTPAGMRTMSDPSRASLRPDGVGSWPLTMLLVLMWLKSAATPAIDRSALWPLSSIVYPNCRSLEAAIGCSCSYVPGPPRMS